MHVANLIEDACGKAARMKWTIWKWLYKLEKGMKVHGMVVFVGWMFLVLKGAGQGKGMHGTRT
ncbi:pentatricopeptide repeat-containing protein [Pyrus ussuriensis x Pyrus communis]|uniref:Pentatricopeptide repeat-containing protein n=1 Tax=Pyrus ussuriensis x Pyrus communis TaxID=2448454 RepID=A0A5N5HL93_9ROSA|nr:pentatricopeptide repeat-containing protein [Pyrus ussuriensis x Pyrus communis]